MMATLFAQTLANDGSSIVVFAISMLLLVVLGAAVASAIRVPSQLLRACGVQPASLFLAGILDSFYASKKQRRLVLCGGRGSRKSSTAAEAFAFEAVVRHRVHERRAKPGTRITYAIVAPGVRQGREAFRAVCAVLDSLAPYGVRYEARGEGDTPELAIVAPRSRCDAVIAVMPADPATLRSFAFGALWSTESGHHADLETIVNAIEPRMLAQFGSDARTILESSPGAPAGLFHDLVTRPDPATRVERFPTWVAVPPPHGPSEAELRASIPDVRVFEQEIAARSFGFAGEYLIDGALVEACIDATTTARGPRPAYVSIGGDFASTGDRAAVVAVSTYFVGGLAGDTPVRHVVVEALRLSRGSRAKPLLVREWVHKDVLPVVRAFPAPDGRAPVVRIDNHCANEIVAELREVGVSVQIARMDAATQTNRWQGLASLVRGQRLHLPPADSSEAARELIRELSTLRAVELPSGHLRVDGEQTDDTCDALLLAALDGVPSLPVSDSDVDFIVEPITYRHGEGLVGGERRWIRRLPNGRTVPAEVPSSDPRFEEHAREMLAMGITTDAIDAWRRERGELPPLNVPVKRD